MKTLFTLLLLAASMFPAVARGDPAERHGNARAARSGDAEETNFGRPADPKEATRTIRIDMSDKMRFSPAVLKLAQGETIRFIVRNSGKGPHEMVLGTEQELEEHAAVMRRFPGMEHDEAHMLRVKPGESRSLTWQFSQAGEFRFGCLIPGHFEAGMVGRISVVAQQERAERHDGGASSSAGDASLTQGEIRKVDKEAMKLTIRHGPIRNLDMPAMTMIFRVKEPAMLERLKAGDRIEFVADKINGAYTVIQVNVRK